MLTYIRVMDECGETFRSFHIRFLPSVLFLLAILLVFVRTDAPFFGLSEDFPPTLLRVRASLSEACFWVGSRGATPPLRGLCYLDLPHVGLGVATTPPNIPMLSAPLCSEKFNPYLEKVVFLLQSWDFKKN